MGNAMCEEAPDVQVVCTPKKHYSPSTLAECPSQDCAGAGKKRKVCRSCGFLSSKHDGQLVCRKCFEKEKKGTHAHEKPETPPTTRA
eukprot:CAMPEP_0170467082 /NCGR_PEP_ID=MMETSP0123-20130129/10794_1 /TAXON_ID=182087 /ORGANISM="Favella ehrenbergii, Strain Fehren 1" /LENGTH=86 /DNA_ID=CAMNT_0010733359 /DNA_START=14 /DNA_END=274 /DNA_ORIENTATION=+